MCSTLQTDCIHSCPSAQTGEGVRGAGRGGHLSGFLRPTFLSSPVLASVAEPPQRTVCLVCWVHFPGLGEEEGKYFTCKDGEQTEEGWGGAGAQFDYFHLP